MKVEILYLSGCPNHSVAVDRVRKVLTEEGMPADTIEVEVKDADAAQRVGFLGSPTIRVDGHDVELAARETRTFGLMCRTYIEGSRRVGVPPPEWIRAAVREAAKRQHLMNSKTMRLTERLAPAAAALSALATLACCLPLGIAGAAGALGLSVALASLRPWLIALALVLLGIGFWQLYRGQRSCRRRSRLSLILFGLSAAVVLGVIVFPQMVAELMAALP